jgi:hypothetical protein
VAVVVVVVVVVILAEEGRRESLPRRCRRHSTSSRGRKRTVRGG